MGLSQNKNPDQKSEPVRSRDFLDSNVGTYLMIAVVLVGALAAIGCLYLDCV